MERIAFSTREALAARHSITEDARYRSEERSLFYTVRKCSQSYGIDTLECVAFCRAVSHNTRELRYFSNPATVLLAVKFHNE